jgi:hypothetical protein
MKKYYIILTAIALVVITGLQAQKTWTGASSTAWNLAGNWNPSGIPIATDNVTIPSGTTNSPTVSGSTGGVCNNLTVNSGATLTISATSGSSTVLTVGGTATFNGALSIGGHYLGNTGKLIAGNVVWNSTSSINAYFGGRMEVSGNYTFASGSSINLGLCFLTFNGGSNSYIYNHSASSSFGNVTLSKTGSAVVYIDASSASTMTIDGVFNINSGSVFIGQPNITTILKGNLVNSGNIYLNSGTLSLEKASGTQDIQVNTNDYFNSLKINTAGTVTLSTSYYLQLKGSMNIQAGVLNPQNNTIALFGDWSNTVGTAGFEEGIGRVNFNGGNYHQYCSNETFFTLEVQKTIGGALRMNGTSVTCSKYDWTAGAIDVINNGTFTVSNQLLDNGIAGNFYLNSGCTINLTNLTGNVDLKGNLYIYGGNFNVYGGINPSWWPSGGNASITMSGGVLDFVDQSILVKTDATYTFSQNITGGTIRTAKNFSNGRADFTPAGGTIELYGSTESYLLMTTGNLYTLRIDKTTGTTVSVDGNATINGGLTINSGTLRANNKILTTGDVIVINNGGTLWMDLNSQLKISPSKTLNVFSGGTFRVVGTSGNEPVITRNGSSGYYVINISSGGTIAAKHASFYYVDPLRVYSGATIEESNPFSYCKFRYAQFGMLRIDNSQNLLIRNAEFLQPATGYNVYKSVNSGTLEFKDAYGDYSGSAYENDPYNRINWTVTQPGLWTGAVSTSWSNIDNWDDFTVPVAGTNVTIPASAPFMPVLDAGTWACNNLTVNGSITFAGANLTANGNLTMNGLLAMNNASSQFTVVGDVAWNSGSTANITANSIILVNGHWNFNAGSNAQLDNGRVYFQGTSSKWIRCYSATSNFYSVYVTKTGGAQAGFSDLSTQPMVIKGELRIFANGKFVSDSYQDVILHGNLVSDGTTQCNGAAFKLDGTDQSLKPNTNDYFNHLVFSQTGTASINTGNTTVINVKGNLHIDSGVFNAGNCTINVEGDWDNNVGPAAFTEGGSRVVFKGGNYHQYILQDEDFSTLEVNKPSGGALRIQGNSIVNTAAYDWTAGAVDMVNGSFTATTLLDNGIAGNFYVNAGTTVTLGNMSGFPHLKGNLFISGGTMNIIAPIESQWPGNGNASITMSGGELNVYPYGIEIVNNPPYTFTTNITGGTIRTEGAFINHRSDFNPAGGTVELYGINNTSITMNAGSLRGVTINKPTDKTVTLATNATVNDLLTIQSGTLHVNNKVLTTGGNIAINNGGTLWMDLNSQLKIAPNKFLDVNTGGLLKTIGTAGNEVVVTVNGTGYYYVYINGTGTISARRTSFYYVNPITVGSSAVIDPANPFDYCKFRYCATEMLRVLSNQELLIRNVEFLTPAAGINVSKPNDGGLLTFKDAYGDFSGPDFEQDPYNRIHWTYTQPGLWTGAVSTNWYTADNWDDFNIPTAATDVVIPATAPNMPVIDAGEWECNHLDIEGTLTIAGANLTAYGNLTVTGTLAMNAPADQLTVIGNVVWESGSQAAITADVVINVCGNWNFNAGSLAEIDNGMVNFTGNQSKWIRNYSETSRFNDIYVTKTSGFQIGFSDLSTEPLLINGKLIVFSNSKFVSDSYEDVILKGDLSSNGITQFNGAALKLDGADQSIIPNTNDYFNHLVFSQTGTVSINTIFTSVINVKGNLHIDSGVFNAGSCTINIEGDWDNNVGPAAFTEGGSRVVFKGGNYHQYIFQDEDFATLEVNKSSGGALRIQTNAIVNVAAYDWTAGAVDMISGSFTATTLLDNGIAGSFYVNSGTTVTLGNMSGFPHLKGNLFISGGTMNIIAPIESEWPGNGNASITMSGGELNVYPYGIEIVNNPSYTFTANITGGTIRTEGAFINNRSDFNPTGGTVELYGSQNASLTMSGGTLYNLTIDKSAANNVSLSTNVYLGGGLTIDGGTLNLNAKTLATGKESAVNDGGVLHLNAGSTMLIEGSFWVNINSGGLLKVIGAAGNPALISRNGALHHIYININSGATISARNARFLYLNPLYILPGGIIDPDNPLDDCQFSYSQTGMLRCGNDQTLLIRNTEFLTPATGYNVYKTNTSGSITFRDASGNYSGEAYENDPHNCIHWTYSQPGLWTGAVSTNWYTGDNWDDGIVPNAGTNVTIPASAPYMPALDAGVWECNNLTINGTLTFTGANLIVNGNMSINGTLAMNAPADQLIVMGDVIWESGSQANITADAAILVNGHWNFNAGSNAQLNNGRVYFQGTSSKWICCYSATSNFYSVYVTKTGGTQAGFSDLSTQPMVIKGELRIFANGKFVSDGYLDVILQGDLISDGSFEANEGVVWFTGVNQSIKPNAGNYFNNVAFSQSGALTINTTNTSTLNINGNFYIDAGVFHAGNTTIKVGGSWNNLEGPAAFDQAGSRVIFNGGNYHQYIFTNEDFNILEVDKPLGGALRVNLGSVVNCNYYDWTAGALDMLEGNFTAISLLDNGIAGDFYTNPGSSITLGNMSGFPHLKGNLFINGGTFNIIAPIESQWPGNGNASITMSGGVLNVYPYGIEIVNNPPYTFTTNITGGTIRTEGAFINYRSDFNPTGGTLELYGTGNSSIDMQSGQLWDININKTGTEDEVLINSNLTANSVVVNSGVLKSTPNSNLIFKNAYAYGNGTIWLTEGTDIKLKGSYEFGANAGKFMFMGEPDNYVSVGRHGQNYVNFYVGSGGFISAKYVHFSDLLRGPFVMSDGIVDTDNAFTGCTFENGYYSLIKIENNQDLTIHDAHFPSVSAPFNARKLLNQGSVTFINADGPFAGSAFEDDPYNRIHWTTDQNYVNAKVFLEGPYNGTNMNALLKVSDGFPLSQPYNTAPWNYFGTESVTSVPVDIVDWVLVEFRDAPTAAQATNATTFKRMAAFLKGNGTIVGLDGASMLEFDHNLTHQLYLAVFHRNHLGVISANALQKSGDTYTYDFSTGLSQAYGGNLGYKEINGTGVMVAGDGNADRYVLQNDKTNVWNPQAGKLGYLSGDFNLDGHVNNADKNDSWMQNISKQCQVPE